ncbi:MAG: HAD family hydrolase, partial [Algoriphagus sp.]
MKNIFDRKITSKFLYTVLVAFSVASCSSPKSADESIPASETDGNEQRGQLASWQDEPRDRIMDWVTSATTEGNSGFIPIADRIAVFDNDGTLWSEQPIYFQLAFAIDEVKRMAPEHPEWKKNASIKALIEGDMDKFLSGGQNALVEALAITHSGMSVEEFDSHVKAWMNTATHPKSGKHYNEMIYQPMLELLDYLRANDFKTFIVSGGGIDFMRAWTEEAYGIPPYQVV